MCASDGWPACCAFQRESRAAPGNFAGKTKPRSGGTPRSNSLRTFPLSYLAGTLGLFSSLAHALSHTYATTQNNFLCARCSRRTRCWTLFSPPRASYVTHPLLPNPCCREGRLRSRAVLASLSNNTPNQHALQRGGPHVGQQGEAEK